MRIKIIVLYILIISLCVLSAGCPGAINNEDVKSGDFFRSEIVGRLHNLYGVNFSTKDVPIVNIKYDSTDGTKTAEFQLDGYDSVKEIGYKLVTKADKSDWEDQKKDRKSEELEISDIAFIQQSCLEYDYPIILISSYMYQDDTQRETVLNNLDLFRAELNDLLDSDAIRVWAQEGLYDGNWIREAIVENYRDSIYELDFTAGDLPTVSIKYGQNSMAVFQLDGYDQNKKAGYKFVTAADEEDWNEQRESGSEEAPDLNYYETIRKNALNYDFPVILIYYPDYWGTTINIILSDNSNDILVRLKDWLKIS